MGTTTTVTDRWVHRTVPVDILLVGEQPVFSVWRRKQLEREPGFSVVGDASGADHALKAIEDERPDVVIVNLPRRPLVCMMRALQNRTAGGSRARTILLATTIGKTDVIQAEALGVSGILSKKTSLEVLFDCVRSVAAGYCWRGRRRLDDLADGMRDLSAIHENRFGLTKRELEVVECILRGDRNKRIASRLSIAESTVEHHLSRVFRKIGVFGRVQLAAFALNHQLIPRAGMAWDGRTPCGRELAPPASSASRVH